MAISHFKLTVLIHYLNHLSINKYKKKNRKTSPSVKIKRTV